jgi:hypothetical protein
VLVYDGRGDNDALKVVATAGADTITLTPGTSNDTGTLAVNGLLAVGFTNLGSSAALVADGGGGIDTFIYNGTNANDLFTVGASPVVNLNARLGVATANVENLTLQGFAGDDTLNLTPDVASSPYGAINFNGGGQASALGDRANLSGTGGADSFNLSGQSVSVGGKSVNGSGVENISLAMGGGADTISYAGVAATAEAIEIVGSITAGTGEIRVPGVAAYSFTGAEVLFASGNAGDADSLTFSGTDDPELYQINTQALGTAGDPVLRFQNASGATLLTLANYSGFATLNINGLDGADVFNVFTGPARGRDVFIDAGSPTAKKKSTDKLFVFYSGQRPKIIQSTATQLPRSGLIDINYGTSRSVIKYADMEDVVITK